MAWTNKAKVPQSGDEEEILTPDLEQILVGVSEDEVLIYQVAYSNWSKKTRNPAGSWILKSK
jgi:hypothetical protein